MFEKEAEEIAKDIYIHHFDDNVIYPNVLKAVTVGVQKGAEFGYNKASEQLKEVVETCNHWQEVAEKANEWHYVKDGDLPKEGISVLVMLENGQLDISGVSKDNRWFCTDYYTGEDKVIAWKEIVLPELKESE